MVPLSGHLPPVSSRSRGLIKDTQIFTTQHRGLRMAAKLARHRAFLFALILVVSGTFQALMLMPETWESSQTSHSPSASHPISHRILSSTPVSWVLSDWHCFNGALFLPTLIYMGSLNWSVCLPAYSPTPSLVDGCHYHIPQCVQSFKTLTPFCFSHCVRIPQILFANFHIPIVL